MRYRRLSFAVLLVVFIVSSSGRSNGQAPAAGGAPRSDTPRIAYVNLQTIASGSVLGKQFRARVEDLTAKKGTPAAIAKLQGDLQAEFQERLMPILKLVGKERGLQLIFSSTDSGIAWADESVPDLSAEVIKRLDGGATAAAAQPAPSGPETIQQEIERIRAGAHAAMPTPQVESGRTTGDPTMTIENGTPYTLTVMLSGPTTRKMTLAPGDTQTVTIKAGAYDKAATVSDTTVMPFYGKQTVEGGTRYSSRFYVKAP